MNQTEAKKEVYTSLLKKFIMRSIEADTAVPLREDNGLLKLFIECLNEREEYCYSNGAQLSYDVSNYTTGVQIDILTHSDLSSRARDSLIETVKRNELYDLMEILKERIKNLPNEAKKEDKKTKKSEDNCESESEYEVIESEDDVIESDESDESDEIEEEESEDESEDYEVKWMALYNEKFPHDPYSHMKETSQDKYKCFVVIKMLLETADATNKFTKKVKTIKTMFRHLVKYKHIINTSGKFKNSVYNKTKEFLEYGDMLHDVLMPVINALFPGDETLLNIISNRTAINHSAKITDFAVCGNYIVVFEPKGTISAYTVDGKKVSPEYVMPGYRAKRHFSSPDQKHVVLLSKSGMNILDENLTDICYTDRTKNITHVSVGPDGKTVAILYYEDYKMELIVSEFVSGKAKKIYKHSCREDSNAHDGDNITGVCYRDNSTLLVTYIIGDCRVIDFRSGKLYEQPKPLRFIGQVSNPLVCGDFAFFDVHGVKHVGLFHKGNRNTLCCLENLECNGKHIAVRKVPEYNVDNSEDNEDEYNVFVDVKEDRKIAVVKVTVRNRDGNTLLGQTVSPVSYPYHINGKDGIVRMDVMGDHIFFLGANERTVTMIKIDPVHI